jgi:hypothetical protein
MRCALIYREGPPFRLSGKSCKVSMNEHFETANYKVRSFFNAVHTIAYRTLRRDRGLCEYIQICIILGKLLHRLFVRLKRESPDYIGKHWNISKTIGLLVCLPNLRGCPYSEPIVGFSLCGTESQKRMARRDRILNLDVLNTPFLDKERWKPGNCAESETFGHLKYGLERLAETAGSWRESEEATDMSLIRDRPPLFSISLTYTLSTLRPKPFCRYCVRHAAILGELHGSIIADLCPWSINIAS